MNIDSDQWWMGSFSSRCNEEFLFFLFGISLTLYVVRGGNKTADEMLVSN